jgi:hypothetical protein
VDEIIAQLVAGGVVDRSRLQGCSEAEIAAIEHERGVALPGAYRTFLAAMGKSPGGFLRGSDLEYSALRSLRAWAEELLVECDAALELDLADFVFVMHQGYQFLFFRCGVSDDPPVYLFLEHEPRVQRVAESFSSWLASAAQDEIEAVAALQKYRT